MTDLSTKLVLALAKRDGAKALLSEQDIDEIKQREEIALLESEAAEACERKRKLDIDRCLDALSEDPKYSGTPFGVAIPTSFHDWFVVKRNSRAHSEWQKAVHKAALNPKSAQDSDDRDRRYAMACVVAWNGRTDLDGDLGPQLTQFLQANPGVVTAITNVAGELSGAFAESFKRGG
jgi:hypothetical protein